MGVGELFKFYTEYMYRKKKGTQPARTITKVVTDLLKWYDRLLRLNSSDPESLIYIVIILSCWSVKFVKANVSLYCGLMACTQCRSPFYSYI